MKPNWRTKILQSKAAIAVCVCIIIVNIAINLQTLSYDVALSDETAAIQMYRDGFTAQNLKNALWGSSIQDSCWEPVSRLLCLTDAAVFKNKPGPRHLVNLLLHTGNALLLFGVLFLITRQVWQSGFVALLFASHPINVESVAWIALHDTPLSGFFMILGIMTYLHYTQKPSVKRYLLLSFLFTLGLMSNPRIILFPVILLVLDCWPLQRHSRPPIPANCSRGKTLAIEKVPLFMLISLWIAGSWFFYHQSDFSRLDMAARLNLSSLTEVPASYMRYISRIFLPINLAPARLMPAYYSPPWQKTVSSILMAGITGSVLFMAKKNRRYLAVGWFWFLLAMAPGVVLDAMKYALVTDRYAYIGAIGIFIAVAWGTNDIIPTLRHKHIFMRTAGLSVIILLTSVSWFQTRHWQNSVTMLSHVIRLAPGNDYAYWQLGDALRKKGRNTEALAAYRKALAGSPDSEVLYNSIGLALMDIGNIREAAAAFEKALELDPRYATAYHNLGNLLLDEGKVLQAIASFKKALEIEPSLFQAHNSLATALLYEGQTDQARYHLRQALRINPLYRTAKENLKKIGAVRKYDVQQKPHPKR